MLHVDGSFITQEYNLLIRIINGNNMIGKYTIFFTYIYSIFCMREHTNLISHTIASDGEVIAFVK